MCLTFKKNNKHTKKPVNRFLQDDASAGLRSLQTSIEIKLCQNPSDRLLSQKTQGFCVADFAALSDERRSRSKIFPLFMWIKEPCVQKSEEFTRSKLLGISQTNIVLSNATRVNADSMKFLKFPTFKKPY